MPVVVVHANEALPETLDASLYLCGPTPALRSEDWRHEAIGNLTHLWSRQAPDRELVVLYPEPRTGSLGFDEHVEWEERALSMADVIMFFVPRSLPELPGLISNVKFGRFVHSGRVVLGAPVAAVKNEYLVHLAGRAGVTACENLESTSAAAVALLAEGVPRSGPLTAIPAGVLKDPRFSDVLRLHGWPATGPTRCACIYTRAAVVPGHDLDWAVDMTWDRDGHEVVRLTAASTLGWLVVQRE